MPARLVRQLVLDFYTPHVWSPAEETLEEHN